MNDDDVGDQLYLLSKTPSLTILTFQGYEINENTFYTNAQDKKSTNQNRGVRFDAATDKEKRRYGNLTMDLSLRSLCFGANGSS